MTGLLGLAGPAETGILYGLMIAYGWLFLVAVSAAVGLFTDSRIATGIALVLMILLTLLASPWKGFWPIESQDPDVESWAGAARVFGGWWCMGLVMVFASTLRVLRAAVRPGIAGRSPAQPIADA